REAPLTTAAEQCAARGVAAVPIVADVRDQAAMNALAARALNRFGHIDVWVNNAGVGALGAFEDLPPNVVRGLIETDFFGCVHGARAVLRHFVAQGHGVLINTASMLGK